MTLYEREKELTIWEEFRSYSIRTFANKMSNIGIFLLGACLNNEMNRKGFFFSLFTFVQAMQQVNENENLSPHLSSSTIVGRRIIKSNIQMPISRQYSVSSFVHLKYRRSTMDLPFQIKDNLHFIQPQIRQRIETLQQAVYRTQSFFER